MKLCLATPGFVFLVFSEYTGAVKVHKQPGIRKFSSVALQGLEYLGLCIKICHHSHSTPYDKKRGSIITRGYDQRPVATTSGHIMRRNICVTRDIRKVCELLWSVGHVHRERTTHHLFRTGLEIQ